MPDLQQAVVAANSHTAGRQMCWQAEAGMQTCSACSHTYCRLRQADVLAGRYADMQCLQPYCRQADVLAGRYVVHSFNQSC